MKTLYERDDVSEFRRYVREKRFAGLKYQVAIEKFLLRFNSLKEASPPIILFTTAKGSALWGMENIGAGKTDFTYFSAALCRKSSPDVQVFAFPDIYQTLQPGQEFYPNIFSPEILRLSEKRGAKIAQTLSPLLYLTVSLLKRLGIIIRVNVTLFISFIAFLAGAISVEFLAANTDLIDSIWQKTTLPIVLFAFFIWITKVWDKISKEDAYKHQWTENAYQAIKNSLRKEKATFSTKELAKKFSAKKKNVLIIDDTNNLNVESIRNLLDLVDASKKKNKKETSYSLGIIFIADHIERNSSEISEYRYVAELLNPYKREAEDQWLHYELDAPSINLIEILLEGCYESREPWRKLKDVFAKNTSLELNPGFLLQFLFDETSILENRGSDLSSIDDEALLKDSYVFQNNYSFHAHKILERIPDEVRESSSLFLKYVLAFDSQVENVTLIKMLLERDGVKNYREIEKALQRSKIIKKAHNNYRFVSKAEQNVLLLNWHEWRDSSTDIYTNVFNIIREVSSSRYVDNPRIALKCTPSLVIVDVLWREGDSLWFYGGNVDVRTALIYYGLNEGALGKWMQIFDTQIIQNSVGVDIFLWTVHAKNSPFRFKTSRSPRTISFIGDLLQTVASLYFIAGEYKKALDILENLWGEIKRFGISSGFISEKTKKRILDADTAIKFQYADFLLRGPINNANWKKASSVIVELGAGNKSESLIRKVNLLKWKANYISKYGAGNAPSSLNLINHYEPEQVPNLEKKQVDIVTVEVHLMLLQHMAFYMMSNLSNGDANIELLEIFSGKLVELDAHIQGLEKKIDISLKKNYPLLEGAYWPLPNADVETLLFKGLHAYFTGLNIFFVFQGKPKVKTRYRATQDCGVAIAEQHQEFVKSWNEYAANMTGNDSYSDLLDLKEIEGQLFATWNGLSKPRKRDAEEILQGINTTLENLFQKVEELYYRKSNYFLTLASKVSSINLDEYDLLVIAYQRISIPRLTQHAQSHEIAFSHSLNVVSEIETKKHQEYLSGINLDSLRAHTVAGEVIGGKYFDISYSHYEHARNICDLHSEFTPAIVKGHIISRQLDTVGNLEGFKHPQEILQLAQQALEIFNASAEKTNSISDIENLKATARWWIAEACSRLASENPKEVDSYFEIARQHINWISRQAEKNSNLAYRLPKNKQVISQFLFLQKNYIESLNLLRSALDEVENDLGEQIQTLVHIIQAERRSLYGKKLTEDQWNAFVRDVLLLREKLKRFVIENKKISQQNTLHLIATHGLTFFGSLVWTTELYQAYELSAVSLEYWILGIKGYLLWGMAGKGAIELATIKELSFNNPELQLPLAFDQLVQQCFLEWDPRQEKTNISQIEQAFRLLLPTDFKFAKKEDANKKKEVLMQVQKIMARPNPETGKIASMLKEIEPTIASDDPAEEDLQVVQVLIACCKMENRFSEVNAYKLKHKELSNVLASKTYLEVAKSFSDSPEIRDRYLHMASTKGNNKFSAEALDYMTELLNKNGVRQENLKKDIFEKINYQRLMGISNQEYDISEAVNLLFLLENELRRLIAYQFGLHKGWWKKGVPQDIYARITREKKDKLKGLDLLKELNLGDLFKIIQFTENWDNLFEPVFLSISFIKSRESIVLPARNKLAHTNPDITSVDLEEFVSISKNIITRIQTFIPG
jgi:hypothetical protein